MPKTWNVGNTFGNANLLVNGGFESDFTGWVTTGGAAIRIASPAPQEGSKYAYGSNTALFTLRQDVDLLAAGFTAAAIDAGSLVAEFGGWQAGYQTQTDEGKISLLMLDASGGPIGNATLAFFHSNSTWALQSGSAPIVPQTRALQFLFEGVRHEGSNDDAYLDGAFVQVSAVPLPATLPLLLPALGVLLRRKTGEV